jgi:hypothetical protein
MSLAERWHGLSAGKRAGWIFAAGASVVMLVLYLAQSSDDGKRVVTTVWIFCVAPARWLVPSLIDGRSGR